MNPWLIILLIAFTPALAIYSQSSPRFEITRSVIGGGAAPVSVESGYELENTVGQPLTATAENGRFSICSGFWVWPASLILGAKKTGSDFIFSFQTEVGKNYVIQFKDSLTETGWQSLPASPGNGFVKTAIIAAPAIGQRFYRLLEQGISQ